MTLLPASPEPHFVMSADGLKIATYDFGEPDAPTVVALHGFASSALANWQKTGWVRDLTRRGFRVIAFDHRGHGASDKPHSPDLYSMELLVADLTTVMDTYLLDEVALLGYSLGARVSWHASLDLPHHVTRAVLGGIPDGDSLVRFRLAEAREAIVRDGATGDRLTDAYLEMAAGIPGNDRLALVDLVEGMRGGLQPDLANPPQQPVLFATGSEDPILERSRALAGATPHGRFIEIPGRNHFNAPTSKHFREAAIDFLAEAHRA